MSYSGGSDIGGSGACFAITGDTGVAAGAAHAASNPTSTPSLMSCMVLLDGMKRAIAFLLVVTACEREDKQEARPPSPSAGAPSLESRGTVATPRPCPTGPALEEAFATAVSIDPKVISEISCDELAAPPRRLWL